MTRLLLIVPVVLLAATVAASVTALQIIRNLERGAR